MFARIFRGNTLATATVAALASSLLAPAASITWSSAPYVHTPDPLKNTMGIDQFDQSDNLFLAVNCGGFAETLTQSTDPDISFTDSDPKLTLSFGSTYDGFHANPSTANNNISRTGRYAGGAAGTVTLYGLTNGETYRVQAYIMDGRSGQAGRYVEFDGADQGLYGNGVGGVTWGNGLLVTGTFTADSFQQSFAVRCFNASGSAAGPQLNAILVHTTATASPASFWDTNGATAGSGDAGGTWDSDLFWTADADGLTAPTTAWNTGDTAVFSAGTDGTGSNTVTITGTQDAGGVWVQEGDITLTGGTLDLSAGPGLLQGDDFGLIIDSTVTATNLLTAGDVTLNSASNSFTGTALLDGIVTLGADHTFPKIVGSGVLDIGTSALTVGDATDSTFGGSIEGSVGSALVKIGAGTLTLGNSADTLDTITISAGGLALSGDGTASWTLSGPGTLGKAGGGTLTIDTTADTTGFTGKTVVSGGILRIPDQTTLGTTPGSPVADQITLSGGGRIQGGDSIDGADLTLDANRGITIDGGNSGFHTWPGFTTTVDAPIVNGNIQIEVEPGVFETQKGNLTFSDGGTLILNGGSGHLGDTRVEGGTVDVRSTISDSNKIRLRGTSTLAIGPLAVINATGLVTSDGGSAHSTVTHNGGILNISGTENGNNTGRSILLGHWGAGSASTVYDLSAGELNAPGAEIGFGWDSGDVTFNHTGGTANILGLDLGDGRNNAATYNLEGGTLNIGAAGMTNAGNKVVNLGGATLGSLDSWTGAKPLVLTGTNGDITISPSAGHAITLTGDLSGAGGLIKDGSGTLALAGGAGTYAGNTQVNGGMLQVTSESTGTSPVTVASGGMIGAGSPGVLGAGIVETLTLAAGSSSNFRMGEGLADELEVYAANGLTVTSPHTINAQPTGALILDEQFPVILYNGTIQGSGFAGFTLAALPNPHYTMSLVDNAGANSIDIKIGAVTPVTWTGASSTAWDLTSANWDAAGASNFYESDIALFGDLGAAESVVVDTLGGTAPIEPASITFSNTAATTYTVSGDVISGATGWTQTGDGTVIVTNDNTYTGLTDIQAGTLQFGDGGTTGSVPGNIEIGAGALLAFDRSDEFGVTAVGGQTISGDGAVEFNGTGTMTLAGRNSFTGGLTVNTGTVILSGGGWYQNPSSGTGTMTVNTGATAVNWNTHSFGGRNNPEWDMVLNGGAFQVHKETYVRDITMTGGTIANYPGEESEIRAAANGSTDIIVEDSAIQSVISCRYNTVGASIITVYDPDTAFLISGAITGGGALIKDGPGTMSLTGDNTNTGELTIDDGTVSMSTATLDDASAVNINGSGVLDLAHGATDVVDVAFIDGGQLDAGTWGTTASGATYTDNVHFAGTGMLEVTTSPDDYATWSAAQAWTPGDPGTAPAEDYDADGLTNEQEWAFGLVPTDGTSVNPISVPLDGGTGMFSYTRRGTDLTGLSYTVETSPNLVDWTSDATATQTPTPADPTSAVQTVAVTLTGGAPADPVLFVRVVAAP